MAKRTDAAPGCAVMSETKLEPDLAELVGELEQLCDAMGLRIDPGADCGSDISPESRRQFMAALANLTGHFAGASEVDLFHARQNVLMRREFELRCGGFQEGPAERLHMLELEGRIFGVRSVDGLIRYPAMQFDSLGEPFPEVAQVLGDLRAWYAGWEIALWWVSANEFLGGEAPIVRWPVDRKPVVWAAAQEREMFSDLAPEGASSWSASR